MTSRLKKDVEESRKTWSDAFAMDGARQRRIQGVNFDIWARGHSSRTRMARMGFALLSIIRGPFRLAIYLPTAFLEWLPRLIVSLGLALFLARAFSLDGISASFLLGSVLLWTYFSDLVRATRNFFFDLFDLLSLGYASIAFANRNILVSLRNEDKENFEVKSYILFSRPLISGDAASEIEAFGNFLEASGLDLTRIDSAIEGYWASESMTYWRNLSAVSC